MRRLALAWLVVLGCTKAPTDKTPAPTPTPPTPTPTPTPTPPTPPKPAPPGQWDCTTDADCMNSCAAGAVNRQWYASANVQECEDGCDNQVTAAPRCESASCVAYQEDPHDPSKPPTRSDYCTHKTITP
jgi:hypothetical protein